MSLIPSKTGRFSAKIRDQLCDDQFIHYGRYLEVNSCKILLYIESVRWSRKSAHVEKGDDNPKCGSRLIVM